MFLSESLILVDCCLQYFEIVGVNLTMRDVSRELLSESLILMGMQDAAGVECFSRVWTWCAPAPIVEHVGVKYQLAEANPNQLHNSETHANIYPSPSVFNDSNEPWYSFISK